MPWSFGSFHPLFNAVCQPVFAFFMSLFFTCFCLLCAVFQGKPCQISVYRNIMAIRFILILNSDSCFQDKPSILLCWPVFSTDGGDGQIDSVQDTHLWSPLQQTVGVLDQLNEKEAPVLFALRVYLPPNNFIFLSWSILAVSLQEKIAAFDSCTFTKKFFVTSKKLKSYQFIQIWNRSIPKHTD